MKEKRSFNKSLVAVSLLLFAVVAGLILIFVFQPSESREGIILPDPAAEPSVDPAEDQVLAGGFLEVHAENVLSVLDSLSRPACYYQSYSVSVSSGRSVSDRTVDIWVNNDWIHGEVSNGHMTKSLFTDGREAWVWNDQELTPVRVELTEELRLEDLLGIPNFDYQQTLRQVVISEAGYTVREEDGFPYVFVCSDEGDSSTEYRFSLDSGLLYSCAVKENDADVYTVRELSFEQLADGDQAFQGRFCLPDGSVPFIAGTRMLQP